jgi:rubredoxin
MDGDRYWLGLYWRNNQYDIEFISDLCDMCLTSNTGEQIVITPWKSFIVKNIKWRDRLGWEKLLGKFGINIRHSSLELNWHLPLLDRNALELKRYLVKVFDQNDISTYGLTFTVKTKPAVLFTAVVIEQNRTSKFAHRYALVNTYNILYSKDFNPNGTEYIAYASDVEREDLAPLLMELSKIYYEQLEYSPTNNAHQSITQEQPVPVHQCKNCLTIYTDQYGDSNSGIAKDLTFDALPDDYTCPVCDAPKSDYVTAEFIRNSLA